MRVKICGLREPTHALAAAEAGADYIGMIFAQSHRRITPEQGRRITEAIEKACFWESRPIIVGVFADQPREEMENIASIARLDMIQLSGGESWELAGALSRPVIKVVKIGLEDTPESLLSETTGGISLLPAGSRVIIEAHVPGAYGGTGQKTDWQKASIIAKESPVILAGGLTPENVAEVIKQVDPWGVDVSSGVETDGVKDCAKIAAFVSAARRAGAV
jgi:phosphoribosylanthranilate isomerase